MFKNIDTPRIKDFEGYSYTNNSGDEEFVCFDIDSWKNIDKGSVVIKESTGREVTIFTADIDKLIKALTLAKQHLETI